MLTLSPADQAHVDQIDADAPPFNPAQLSRLRALFGGARP